MAYVPIEHATAQAVRLLEIFRELGVNSAPLDLVRGELIVARWLPAQ
jgi:hypothetical protein